MDITLNRLISASESSAAEVSHWENVYKNLPQGNLVICNFRKKNRKYKNKQRFMQAYKDDSGNIHKHMLKDDDPIVTKLQLKKELKRTLSACHERNKRINSVVSSIREIDFSRTEDLYLKAVNNCKKTNADDSYTGLKNKSRSTGRGLELSRLIGKSEEDRANGMPMSNSELWSSLGERQNEKYDLRDGNKGPGGMYRSKSELVIVHVLMHCGIAFKYEPEIEIGGIKLHPDFAIRAKDGSIFLWEHLGVMDETRYVQKQIHKLERYATAGILPGVNLILTSDNIHGVVDSEMIERIAMSYCA